MQVKQEPKGRMERQIDSQQEIPTIRSTLQVTDLDVEWATPLMWMVGDGGVVVV